MEHDGKAGAFTWLDELSFNRFHVSTLILGGLTLVAAGFNLQILAYAMPLIIKEWGLSPVQGGAMVSYGLLGLMVGALGFGTIADRIGRKGGILWAVGAFSILGGCASLAGGYLSFCILRFLTGVGIGGAFPLTVAILSEFSPSRVRARLVTAAVSGFTLGWAVAASASIIIIPRYGWRLAFQLGLVSLLLLPALWALLPESIRFLSGKGRCEEALKELRSVEKIAGLGPRPWSSTDFLLPVQKAGGELSDLFRRGLAPMTLLVWSTYLLNTMALYGLFSWLPSLLVQEGFSLARSYSYSMVQAGGSALGGFLLGCLMDRFGRKQGLILTYLLGGLSVVFFGSVTNNLYLFLAGAATGVFVVGTPTALNVVCGEIYPTKVRSTGVASTQAVGRIGSILGPVIGGMLQTLELSFHQFFYLFSIPCFLCMVLVMAYPVSVRGETLEAVSERFRSAKPIGSSRLGSRSTG